MPVYKLLQRLLLFGPLPESDLTENVSSGGVLADGESLHALISEANANHLQLSRQRVEVVHHFNRALYSLVFKDEIEDSIVNFLGQPGTLVDLLSISRLFSRFCEPPFIHTKAFLTAPISADDVEPDEQTRVVRLTSADVDAALRDGLVVPLQSDSPEVKFTFSRLDSSFIAPPQVTMYTLSPIVVINHRMGALAALMEQYPEARAEVVDRGIWPPSPAATASAWNVAIRTAPLEFVEYVPRAARREGSRVHGAIPPPVSDNNNDTNAVEDLSSSSSSSLSSASSAPPTRGSTRASEPAGAPPSSSAPHGARRRTRARPSNRSSAGDSDDSGTAVATANPVPASRAGHSPAAANSDAANHNPTRSAGQRGAAAGRTGARAGRAARGGRGAPAAPGPAPGASAGPTLADLVLRRMRRRSDDGGGGPGGGDEEASDRRGGRAASDLVSLSSADSAHHHAAHPPPAKRRPDSTTRPRSAARWGVDDERNDDVMGTSGRLSQRLDSDRDGPSTHGSAPGMSPSDVDPTAMSLM